MKTGPKLENGKPRVRLGGTPIVAEGTKETLEMWRGLYDVPAGRIIDSLVAFAKENPAFKLPLPKRKLKMPPLSK